MLSSWPNPTAANFSTVAPLPNLSSTYFGDVLAWFAPGPLDGLGMMNVSGYGGRAGTWVPMVNNKTGVRCVAGAEGFEDRGDRLRFNFTSG
jgi:hypothetical protein